MVSSTHKALSGDYDHVLLQPHSLLPLFVDASAPSTPLESLPAHFEASDKPPEEGCRSLPSALTPPPRKLNPQAIKMVLVFCHGVK